MMRQLGLEILNTLHGEHMTTLALLERLEKLLRRHPSTRRPPATDSETSDIVGELVTVMEIEITGHYAFEEEHLFPRFARFADAGIPMMLRGEHETIRPIAKRITEVAREAQGKGFDDSSWSEFHMLGIEMVEREIFHIQKEEMGFLPALDHMLDPAEDAVLVAAYHEMKTSA